MNSERLIIVRAGDSSLHPIWLKAEPNRRWHLHISYFGRRTDPYDLPPGVTLTHDVGPKWIGLSACLKQNPELLNYKYISMPDDDLKVTVGSWDQIFDMFEATNAGLAQPSLDHRSYYWHDVTLRRTWADYREVNFIELMTPIFTKVFLEQVKGIFEENRTSVGLDYLWSYMAAEAGQRMVIIDKCCLLHTREIGKGTQYDGLSPVKDMEALLAKFKISPIHGKSFKAFSGDKAMAVPDFILNRKEKMPRIYKKLKKFMALDVIG